jgi:hypothetical protein
MKFNKKWLWLIIPLLLLLCCGMLLLAFSAFNNYIYQQKQGDPSSREQPVEFKTTKPYFGTVGYTPGTLTSTKFFSEVNKSSEIYGVHTDWQDTEIISLTVDNTDMPLVVMLGYQKPEEWGVKDDEFINAADNLLALYPEIKYLGIGNEINLFKYEQPGSFSKFKQSYKNIYTELKARHPEVKIFTVYQYETLLGANYLSGKEPIYQTDWGLVAELDTYNDLFVSTSYPFLDYKTPAEIPANYYQQIADHTNKSVAFTEFGWLSQTTFSGKNKPLNNTGYEGSEAEQVAFLKRFKELTSSSNLEFANWPFLYEYQDWENNGNSGTPLYDSVGLHKYDGTDKQIMRDWSELVTE